MTDEFKKIENDFLDFKDQVARCRDESNSSLADIKDAYGRMHRVRDRYLLMMRVLSPTERKALRKVFEENNFIAGMGQLRLIAEHVMVKENVVLSHSDNSTFEITPSSSAALVYSDRRVRLPGPNDTFEPWDHLKELTGAVERISTAIRKAKGE